MDTFKGETLHVAKTALGSIHTLEVDVLSAEMLECFEESRTTRLVGNRDQYMALASRTSSPKVKQKEVCQ